MIVTKLVGGLGNQMFQYSVARSISIRTNTELYIDNAEFKRYTVHPYTLNNFNITENIWHDTKHISTYKEKAFNYDESVKNINTDIRLMGYWQTERYFTDIRDVLLKDFTLKTPLTDIANTDILNKINKTNSVSVHFRRGDYINHENYVSLNMDYYHTAIRQYDNPTLFVFSDDIDWVKSNFNSEHETHYIDFNRGKGWNDLYLTSQCKHNIMANSSFSWWGSWLNTNKKKLVICPTQWFKGANLKFDTIDMIPKDWLRL
jgi:hypothetical protein